LHPHSNITLVFQAALKSLCRTRPWHGNGLIIKIMKELNEIHNLDFPPNEALRAKILRAALLQLLAETETQMLRIEQTFQAFDERFPKNRPTNDDGLGMNQCRE
jgi:hypothetical protein